MKKLFLLIGLVVLFFAQSSYAKNYNIEENGRNNLRVNSKINDTHFYKHNKPLFKLEELGLNPTYHIDFEDCDGCSEIYFTLFNFYKTKNELMRFLNGYAKDICNEPKVKIDGKFKDAKKLFGFNSVMHFYIRCPEIEQEKKLAAKQAQQEQEQAMTKEKEQELLASVNAKRELCFSMGFKDGTDPLANCILQLMLSENKKQQVVVTSGNDGLAGAMDEQTRILSKQLRIQKIQLNRENLKRSIYMMNTGKVPTW